MIIDERLDDWIPSNYNQNDIKVVEFCRSLHITNHLILEYGQDLKNNQWILEPFADLAIFSIIDTTFKRFLSLDDSKKNLTKDVLF